MGNPNPSPATRFGAKNGNKPNGGKTSEQKLAEYAAAEKAALIGDRLVSSIMEKLDGGQDAVEFIDAAVLKLLKDVQDRAHGTPTQHVENKHDVADSLTELLGQVADTGKRIGS